MIGYFHSSAVPEIWLVPTKMVHVTWTRPFQRRFVILGPGLATINLPTKLGLYLLPL